MAEGRKLIRTVSLTIRTAQYDEDLDALTQLVKNVGGYIESTYQSGDRENCSTRSSSMTLRIPSEKLDEFLNGLDGVGRVVEPLRKLHGHDRAVRGQRSASGDPAGQAGAAE